MTDSNIQQRIQQQQQAVQEARRAAEQAKAQRVAVENAPEAAVALAEAELRQLQQQAAREAQLAERQHYLDQLDGIGRLIATLTTALESRDLSAAQQAWDDLAQLVTALESRQAVAGRGPSWTAEQQQAYHRLVQDPQMIERARLAYQPIEVFVSQYLDQQNVHLQAPPRPPLPDVWGLLAQWVARVPNAVEQRWRVGLVFAVTGRLLQQQTLIVRSGAPQLMR